MLVLVLVLVLVLATVVAPLSANVLPCSTTLLRGASVSVKIFRLHCPPFRQAISPQPNPPALWGARLSSALPLIAAVMHCSLLTLHCRSFRVLLWLLYVRVVAAVAALVCFGLMVTVLVAATHAPLQPAPSCQGWAQV